MSDTVLVNTQGWVKSLGLVILCELLGAVQPDCIVKVGTVEGIGGFQVDKSRMAKEKKDATSSTDKYLSLSKKIYALSLSEITVEVDGEVVHGNMARRLLDGGIEVGLVDGEGWCKGMGVVEKIRALEGMEDGVAFICTPVNPEILGSIAKLVFGGLAPGRGGEAGGKEVWGEGSVGEGGMASRNNIPRKRLAG